jgi:TPR repeat protein
MSKKPFAPQGVALELPPKIIKTVEKLRDGRSLGKTLFTGKELNAIGLCYWYGHIVKTDYAEAVKWYLAADAKRYRTAAFNLYVCYNNGMGVDEDGKQALYWLRKAARHNDAGAQNILAECYYTGGFVRRNRRLAKLWFQKSLDNALKGNIEVTLNDFGAKYYLGRYGFEKDKEKAMMFFEKAANKGYCLSICWLMSIYIDEDNREKVEYWREKLMASAAKDPRAAELIEQEYNNYIKGKENEQ